MAQSLLEKLDHTGPAEKERVASVLQREQLVGTPEPPLSGGKGTEPSVPSTDPDHEVGESQRGRKPYFGEREEDQSESMERKG